MIISQIAKYYKKCIEITDSTNLEYYELSVLHYLIIANEDCGFFIHSGFNCLSVLRVLMKMVQGKASGGASGSNLTLGARV